MTLFFVNPTRVAGKTRVSYVIVCHRMGVALISNKRHIKAPNR